MVNKGGKVMSQNGLLNGIIKHFQDNFWLYIISFLCICTGIVLGIYTVKYMGDFQKTDLLSYVKSLSSNITNNNISSKSILFETIKNNLLVIIGIWFLGLTMIGIPVILILDIIKGFTIGFTFSFIIGGLGIKGIWVSLLGVLPQNIIYIPCMIFASVIAMEFSLMILKDKENREKSNIWMRVTSYSFYFLFTSVVMFSGFFLEAYLTPNLLKLIVKSTGFVLI